MSTLECHPPNHPLQVVIIEDLHGHDILLGVGRPQWGRVCVVIGLKCLQSSNSSGMHWNSALKVDFHIRICSRRTSINL
jgi:hypothetical protein